MTSPENGTETQNAGGANEPQDVKSLPQWAQNLITNTRSEAAEARVKLREAKDQARNELQAEFDQKATELKKSNEDLQSAVDQKDLNLAKLQVSLSAGLGGEQAVAFASRLQGSNVEELKADAAEALKIFGTPGTRTDATDPSQGLGTETKKTPDEQMGSWILGKLS